MTIMSQEWRIFIHQKLTLWLIVLGDLSVLDVGFGGGHLVSALLNKSFDARGLDISKDTIAYGNKKKEFIKMNLCI